MGLQKFFLESCSFWFTRYGNYRGIKIDAVVWSQRQSFHHKNGHLGHLGHLHGIKKPCF